MLLSPHQFYTHAKYPFEISVGHINCFLRKLMWINVFVYAAFDAFDVR